MRSHAPLRLRHLLVGRNLITRVPRHLPATLKTLVLSANRISSWRNRGVEADADVSGLEELDVSANLLTEVSGLPVNSIRRLDLSGNRLTSLSLSHAPHLRYLDVSSNRLSRVQLYALPSLRHLDVAANRLTELPGRLPVSLRRFSCLDNLLTTPNFRTFDGLNALRHVDMSRNRITALKGAARLPELQSLLLTGNRITTLPVLPFLTMSPLLTVIDFADNRISSLKSFHGLFSSAMR